MGMGLTIQTNSHWLRLKERENVMEMWKRGINKCDNSGPKKDRRERCGSVVSRTLYGKQEMARELEGRPGIMIMNSIVY